MRAYIIRRALLMIPTFFFATLIVFFVIRLIPGSVIDLMIVDMERMTGSAGVDAEAFLKKTLGLDVPVHMQYFRWLGDFFRGELGTSLWKQTSVAKELLQRFPVSLELGLLGVAIAVSIALPIGVYSAIRQDTAGDYTGRSVAVLAISLPSFWLATMVIVFPSIYWNWTPQLEYIPLIKDPLRNLEQFILPAALLGMVMSGTTMRMTRTMMLEVLRQDYIRTAWAKGLRERTVIVRHALKNAFIPVVSIIGLMLPVVIGGSVVIEEIFALPGIGRLLLQAVRTRDYPIISAINVVIAIFILINNLVIDLTYAWLDPRVQYR